MLKILLAFAIDVQAPAMDLSDRPLKHAKGQASMRYDKFSLTKDCMQFVAHDLHAEPKRQ